LDAENKANQQQQAAALVRQERELGRFN